MNAGKRDIAMILAALPVSLIIGAAVILTSMISGVFGMAGGLILMLVLGVLLPVQAAMVLHGVTQFVSNGWRAFLWSGWIRWDICGFYLLGALPATLVPAVLAFVPDKPAMLITLGLIPYAALLIPQKLALDATRPVHAIGCGFLVAGLQLVAGVTGPLLDVFFVRSDLDRRAVVATKAVTQAASHTLKVIYFGALIAVMPDVGADVYGAAILAAWIGTTLAGPMLERFSNAGFRAWTQRIVLVTGAVSILQGLALLSF
jgi:uncharacterized membrane protein YfcA